MEPIIAAEHLGKTYRSGKLEVQALRDVTFTVEPGEFVAIVGPSGSGKSTLFYVLGGLTSATSGSLSIQGHDFSRLNDAQRTSLRRSQIGFVFQRFNLLPTVSALTNIEIAHEIAQKGAKSPKPLDEDLLNHLTQLLKIQGRLDHRPNELSGGEQQRVALARALVNNPRLLLADEPTGDLDEITAGRVFDLIERLHGSHGLTSIMVTHNLDLAARCTRALRLEGGRLVALSTTSQTGH